MSEIKYIMQEKLMESLNSAKEKEAQTKKELDESKKYDTKFTTMALEKRYEKDQGYTNGILEAVDIINRIKED